MKQMIENQAGYLPSGYKRVILPEKVENTAFCLKNSAGEICYEGQLRYRGFDTTAGDDVTVADFSDFQTEGSYTVCVEGWEPVTVLIDRQAYAKTFQDMNKAFYYLRCGCELKAEHAGKFIHMPCHHKPAMLWEDHSQLLEVNGGWHDAGDYGRYITPGACALSHLLYAWKLFPQVFTAHPVHIPMPYGDMPWILQECRYELEWFLKMQRADGGVYHKATTAYHAPFVMPEQDVAQMYVLPVSSMATADLAAIGALAHELYMPYDPAFAEALLSAAKRAGEWLLATPEFVSFKNPEGCRTGEYGEWKDDDNRFWAYCELYAATGEEKYREKLLEQYEKDFPKTHLGYGSVGGFGAMATLFHERREESLVAPLREAMLQEAEKLASRAAANGYGCSMVEEEYGWGSNMTVLKQGMIFAIADELLGSDRYVPNIQAQMDYLLGLNAMAFSYVSGTGHHCLQNPHLRPSAADGIDECIPGMVSGGPNRRPCVEEEKRHIPAGTPPMKCYADVVEGFSVNEITIYWNSPGVFTLASLLK